MEQEHSLPLGLEMTRMTLLRQEPCEHSAGGLTFTEGKTTTDRVK